MLHTHFDFKATMNERIDDGGKCEQDKFIERIFVRLPKCLRERIERAHINL